VNNLLKIGKAYFVADKISGFQLKDNTIEVLVLGELLTIPFATKKRAEEEFNKTIEILMAS
jgi:hypothetical protein